MSRPRDQVISQSNPSREKNSANDIYKDQKKVVESALYRFERYFTELELVKKIFCSDDEANKTEFQKFVEEKFELFKADIEELRKRVLNARTEELANAILAEEAATNVEKQNAEAREFNFDEIEFDESAEIKFTEIEFGKKDDQYIKIAEAESKGKLTPYTKAYFFVLPKVVNQNFTKQKNYFYLQLIKNMRSDINQPLAAVTQNDYSAFIRLLNDANKFFVENETALTSAEANGLLKDGEKLIDEATTRLDKAVQAAKEFGVLDEKNVQSIQQTTVTLKGQFDAVKKALEDANKNFANPIVEIKEKSDKKLLEKKVEVVTKETTLLPINQAKRIINDKLLHAYIQSMRDYYAHQLEQKKDSTKAREAVEKKFAFLINETRAVGFGYDSETKQTTYVRNDQAYNLYCDTNPPDKIILAINDTLKTMWEEKSNFTNQSDAEDSLVEELQGAIEQLKNENNIQFELKSQKIRHHAYDARKKMQHEISCKDAELSPELATAPIFSPLGKRLTDTSAAVLTGNLRLTLGDEKELVDNIQVAIDDVNRAGAQFKEKTVEISKELQKQEKDLNTLIQNKQEELQRRFVAAVQMLVCSEENKKLWKKLKKWSLFSPGAPEGIDGVQKLFERQERLGQAKLDDNDMIGEIFQTIIDRPRDSGRRKEATRQIYDVICDPKTGIAISVKNVVQDFARLHAVTENLIEVAKKHGFKIDLQPAEEQFRPARRGTVKQ